MIRFCSIYHLNMFHVQVLYFNHCWPIPAKVHDYLSLNSNLFCILSDAIACIFIIHIQVVYFISHTKSTSVSWLYLSSNFFCSLSDAIACIMHIHIKVVYWPYQKYFSFMTNYLFLNSNCFLQPEWCHCLHRILMDSKSSVHRAWDSHDGLVGKDDQPSPRVSLRRWEKKLQF